MPSILEETLFNNYITEDFVKKVILVQFIDKKIQEVTINTFIHFIDEQIQLLKDIRKKTISKYYGNIDDESLEEKIKNDIKYNLLLYAKEILILRKEKPNILFSDDKILYSVLSTSNDILMNFIENLQNEKYKLLMATDIEKIEEIKSKYLKEIFNIIELWNEINTIKDVAEDYDRLINSIKENKTLSVYSTLSKFKEIIHNAHIKIIESSLSENNGNNDSFEKLSLISFESESIKKSVSDYIFDSYNIYKTGLGFIDDNIDGFESENIYVYCAPSNNGKSLLLLESAKGVIETNINEFNENDAILFVTLEDNKIKLSRRIFTIFGNYSPNVIKRLYIAAHNKAQYLKRYDKNKLNNFRQEFEHILEKIYKTSIQNITQNKVKFLVQDRADSSYTISDLLQTITMLKLKNINVKAVFIDYIDLMVSSKKYDSDYNEQGQIVKDLRSLSKEFHIPIITATQLQRDAEDTKKQLSNKLMGDSYKKVRNSDYILMIRQLVDESIETLNEQYGFTTKLNSYQIEELISVTFPTEFVFTKVKDTDKSPRNENNKLIFSKFNLTLYDNLDKLLKDMEDNKKKNTEINKYINFIKNY